MAGICANMDNYRKAIVRQQHHSTSVSAGLIADFMFWSLGGNKRNGAREELFFSFFLIYDIFLLKSLWDHFWIITVHICSEIWNVAIFMVSFALQEMPQQCSWATGQPSITWMSHQCTVLSADLKTDYNAENIYYSLWNHWRISIDDISATGTSSYYTFHHLQEWWGL